MSILDRKISSGAWSEFQRLDQGKKTSKYEGLVQAMSDSRTFGRPGSLSLATQLTALGQALSEEETMAVFLIVFCLLEAYQAGSTRLRVSTPLPAALEEQLNGVLTEFYEYCSLQPADIAQLFQGLQASPKMVDLINQEPGLRALTYRNGWLHESNVLIRELALAQHVTELRHQRVSEIGTDLNVDDLPFPLTKEQGTAVKHALDHGLTLITGGPGTGKTSIIVAIIKGCLAAGVPAASIALCAPTGKAAWRMDQAVNQNANLPDEEGVALSPASTLHRMLGYLPRSGQFRRHRRNPIDATVVIVDEASMIDTMLMERLTNAIGPHSRLILLGDCDQLPSVGAGQVYQDLIDAFPEVTVRLTHSFRMRADDPSGSAILTCARAIRDGVLDDASFVKPASIEGLDWRGVRRLDDQCEASEVYGCWYEKFYEQHARATLDAFENPPAEDEDPAVLMAHLHIFNTAQALAVTRSGPNGVDAANEAMRQLHAQRNGLNTRAPFLPGAPVIMRRNDYARGLFNGDQGLVIGSRNAPMESLNVLFRGLDGPRLFPLHGLMGDLDLAFVLTVHQAQGSEYGHVLLLLPSVDVPIMTRQLVYTAITRSRHGVILYGPLITLETATTRSSQRESTLPELLTPPISETNDSMSRTDV